MKKILSLLLLLCFAATFLGCEANAKADKEGVKVEVDKK